MTIEYAGRIEYAGDPNALATVAGFSVARSRRPPRSQIRTTVCCTGSSAAGASDDSSTAAPAARIAAAQSEAADRRIGLPQPIGASGLPEFSSCARLPQEDFLEAQSFFQQPERLQGGPGFFANQSPCDAV